MKINQLLIFIGLSAIISFNFGCVEENSNAEPFAFPKVFSLSLYAAPTGTLITVNGANLVSLDSAKLGKVNLPILFNSATSFKFNIPSNAISGKLYIYKGKTVDSTETLTIKPPQPRNLSPINARIGEKVTIGGYYLGNLDSVKIGSLLVDTMQSNESSFSFRVTQSMFSDKIYIYRGAYVDSSLYITVAEPTGAVTSKSMSWAVNGKSKGPGIGNFMGFRTINNVRMLNLWSYDVASSIEIDLPESIVVNQVYNATETYQFICNLGSFPTTSYIANGNNGTSGTFRVTEIGPNRSYLRGTFDFIAKDSGGNIVKVTNGRVAVNF